MITKLNKNTVVLADQAVFSGGSFLITILLARLLTPTDFGIYSSITLFNFGVISILNALVIQPMQVSLEKVINKQSYLGFTFIVQLSALVFILLSSYLLLNSPIPFLQHLKTTIYPASFLFIGFVLHDYFRKVFLAKAEVKQAFIIDLTATSLQVGLLGYCYLTNLHSFSQILFLLGITYLPAIILSILFFQFERNSFYGYKNYIRLQFHQAKWLVLTTITQWWASNLFIVTSGIYLGVKALGAFRLVQSLFGILNLILQTFENYVLPEASRRYVQSSENARIYLKDITKKSSLIFGVVLTLLFLFSEQVIHLAGGSSYLSYAYIIKGMCILYAFIFIGYPIRLSIRLLILNKLFFVGYVISFIISVLSFDYLLKNWGINGAIIGLTISQLVTLSYWQIMLTKKDFVLWK